MSSDKIKIKIEPSYICVSVKKLKVFAHSCKKKGSNSSISIYLKITKTCTPGFSTAVSVLPLI